MIIHRQEIAPGVTLRIVDVEQPDGSFVRQVQATARLLQSGRASARLIPDSGFRALPDPMAYQLLMEHVVPFLIEQRLSLSRTLSAAVDNAGGELRIPKALLEHARPGLNADFGAETDPDVVVRISGARAQFNASEAAAPPAGGRILVVPG